MRRLINRQQKNEMKIFLIENSKVSESDLSKLLTVNESNQIIGTANNVLSAVTWLQAQDCDLIVTEAEFPDGNCFDIFSQTKSGYKSIIVANSDRYALAGIQHHVLGYLLYPLRKDQLFKVLDYASQEIVPLDILEQSISRQKPIVTENIEELKNKDRQYRKNFIVRVGDKVIIQPMNEIAYFFSKDKTSYLTTFDNKQYIIDQSLDLLSSWLNPLMYFRINRSFIINIASIQSIVRHFSSRMKLQLTPQLDDEIFVSRQKTNQFLQWINQ